jgi:hypothetical protein
MLKPPAVSGALPTRSLIARKIVAVTACALSWIFRLRLS